MPKVSTSYKPGQSGNLNGRPKKEWTMAGILKEALEEQDENGIPYKLTINRKLVTLAKAGDVVAIKEVNNRIDGQSQQKTDITSGGKPIPLLTNLNVSNNDSDKETIES